LSFGPSPTIACVGTVLANRLPLDGERPIHP
jgi:hypothetical protein